MTYKRFFGLTWKSPAKKINKNKANLDFDELAFLSTALKDEHIYIVLEVVAYLKDGRKKV